MSAVIKPIQIQERYKFQSNFDGLADLVVAIETFWGLFLESRDVLGVHPSFGHTLRGKSQFSFMAEKALEAKLEISQKLGHAIGNGIDFLRNTRSFLNEWASDTQANMRFDMTMLEIEVVSSKVSARHRNEVLDLRAHFTKIQSSPELFDRVRSCVLVERLLREVLAEAKVEAQERKKQELLERVRKLAASV